MMKRLSCLMATIVLAGTVALSACEQQPSLAAVRDTAAAGDTASTNETAANETPLAKAAADTDVQWGPCPEGMPQGCGIAVLQGDPAKPNADIFLRVPGGATIPPHAHSSAERMVLVNGQLEVKYQGAAPELLRAGHYAYGPARLPHQATCQSSEECILFIAFEEPVDVLPFEGNIQ